MSWEYGTLAAEVYELDKPVGSPFADVAYYTDLLADVRGRILEPVPPGNSIVSLTCSFRPRGWCGDGWLARCCSRSSAC